MPGRGIFLPNDETPYLFDNWCPMYSSQCGICKLHKNTIRHPYNIVNLNYRLSFSSNFEENGGIGKYKIHVCLSCFEKHKFIRPTEEELQNHIFKLRKKKTKKLLNNYLIKDLTNIILSLDTMLSDDEDDK